ncbi:MULTISPECIES: hypothetical protein [Tepidanaerobacter]|uniref:hypothetical protein n=1 Tax=Tepidanaerobacter TaxID=499228 RepID=UPI001767B9CC|nr:MULTISPECIES: hypothetical protein [Tepidanaerobacter]GLI50899.1 hypothetical protein TSYNTROOL_09850 [Tepidanaerobacter syntrophicus]HHV83350.1 hypothetical protein [Tepidanaerobacter syntrophicus]
MKLSNRVIIPLISNFSSLDGFNLHIIAYIINGKEVVLIDAGNPGDVTKHFLSQFKEDNTILKLKTYCTWIM